MTISYKYRKEGDGEHESYMVYAYEYDEFGDREVETDLVPVATEEDAKAMIKALYDDAKATYVPKS